MELRTLGRLGEHVIGDRVHLLCQLPGAAVDDNTGRVVQARVEIVAVEFNVELLAAVHRARAFHAPDDGQAPSRERRVDAHRLAAERVRDFRRSNPQDVAVEFFLCLSAILNVLLAALVGRVDEILYLLLFDRVAPTHHDNVGDDFGARILLERGVGQANGADQIGFRRHHFARLGVLPVRR